MSCVRILVFSILPLLATIWLITNFKGAERYLGFVYPVVPVAAPAAFDPRLHPEKHAERAPTTIELDWVIQSDHRSPDGVQKTIYTVNGLFPGPTIEARSGDRVILKVYNGLEKESTAIHFHGIRQIGSNSMDGAPGVTQCAIPPKHSFLYNFTINENQSGTYWWHSHSLSQQTDGLFGAFVIHDPIAQKQNPGFVEPGRAKEDLRLRHRISASRRENMMPETASISELIVLVGDWYHYDSSTMLKWYHSKNSFGFEPTPENMLFNGVNMFNCSRAIRVVDCDHSRGHKPSLSLDLHSKTRLRFVNTGSLADLEISLESHSFLIIEADGSPVAPRRVNSVIITPGQRYSVILEPNSSQKPRTGDTFWLRLSMCEESLSMPNPALDSEQYFPVFYGDSPSPASTGPPVSWREPSPEDFDAFSLVPLHQTLLPQADQQLMIYVTSAKLDNLGGIPYGYVNRTSWIPDQHEPLLLRQADSNSVVDWGKNQFVVTTHRERPSVVELIINNMDDGPHPFHLHGHHFYPLHAHRSSYGWGLYNYSSPPPISSNAPVLRDTLVVPRRGYVVIRFLADAPGVWLFHCHMMVHLNTGMAMTFNVRPELVSPYERQIARESCDRSHLKRCERAQIWSSRLD